MTKHLAGGGIVAHSVPETPLTEADYVKIAASALAAHEKSLPETECEIHAQRMFIMLKALGLLPRVR